MRAVLKSPVFFLTIVVVIGVLGFAFSGYFESGDKTEAWARQPRSRAPGTENTGKTENTVATTAAGGCCASSGGCCCSAKGKKCCCSGGAATETAKTPNVRTVQAVGLLCSPVGPGPLVAVPTLLAGESCQK